MMDKDFSGIGEGTQKGQYCVIEDGAVIGKNCVIGHHVVIRSHSVIGDNVRIDDFADIGKLPMKAANSATTNGDCELAPCKIGSGSIIGTSAIVYAGCTLGEDVLIADLATVREDVTIGDKTIIGRGASVENKCQIGSYCKIETDAYICAYSVIEDRCFIAPCVVTSNDNYAGRSEKRFSEYGGITVKKGGRIGAGTVVLPHKVIESDGFAAAGSVITKNVGAKEIFVGNPSKKLRDVPVDQLLENQSFNKK